MAPKGSVPAETGIRTELDEDLIVERLSWTPKQRLDYLLDMLAFEDRARRARRIPAPGR